MEKRFKLWWKNKKAGTDLIYQVLLHLILVGLIFALFLGAMSFRVTSDNVKQQILEKQIALLIDSAMPGTTLVISKANRNGLISGLDVRDGRVFIKVEDLKIKRGYPYFSMYDVSYKDVGDYFYIEILDSGNGVVGA
jgi:hypothetical protein